MCTHTHTYNTVYMSPTVNMKRGGVFYSLIRPQYSLPLSAETKAAESEFSLPSSEISSQCSANMEPAGPGCWGFTQRRILPTGPCPQGVFSLEGDEQHPIKYPQEMVICDIIKHCCQNCYRWERNPHKGTHTLESTAGPRGGGLGVPTASILLDPL